MGREFLVTASILGLFTFVLLFQFPSQNNVQQPAPQPQQQRTPQPYKESSPNPTTPELSQPPPATVARKDSSKLLPDGPGSSFREYLQYTVEEEANANAFQKALDTLNNEELFSWIADTPVKIPPWRPKRATPIVCNGQEYYSAHFSIPEENIVDTPREKTQDWATVVPGRKETYIFKQESLYRKDMEVARFAITRRRYGFATNRNLEMLSAGCIPFFCGVEKVPRTGTLASLPMSTIRRIVGFPHVHAKCFPHKKAAGHPLPKEFNVTMYDKLNEKMLEYTRTSMITQMQALYVLSATSLQVLPKNVLVLWASHYTIVLTGLVHGLRRLGITVEDVPRRPEIYKGEGCEDARAKTYAKGWFFFCKAEESPNLARTNISERIQAKEFDLVIISVTDTLTYHMKDPHTDIPHYKEILASYPRDKIVTINDADLIKPMQADVAHKFMHNTTIYFKRETHGCNEPIF